MISIRPMGRASVDLPERLLVKIAFFLSPKNIARLLTVSASWYQHLSRNELWINLCPRITVENPGELFYLTRYPDLMGIYFAYGARIGHLRMLRLLQGNNVECPKVVNETMMVSSSAENLPQDISLDFNDSVKAHSFLLDDKFRQEVQDAHSAYVGCFDVINNNSMVVTFWDGEIFVRDISINAKVLRWIGYTGYTTRLEVSDFNDQTIQNENDSLQKMLRGHKEPITCLQVTDGTIVSRSSSGTICLWDQDRGSTILQMTHGPEYQVTCFKITDTRIVWGWYKTIRIWDRSTHTLQHTLRGHTNDITCLEIVDNIIISASADKTMRIWDLTSGARLQTVILKSSIYRMKYTDNTLITVSDDGGIRIWGGISREIFKVKILQIADLHAELLQKIASFLSPKNIACLFTVSTNWYKCLSSNELWIQLCPGISVEKASDRFYLAKFLNLTGIRLARGARIGQLKMLKLLQCDTEPILFLKVIGETIIAGSESGKIHSWDRSMCLQAASSVLDDELRKEAVVETSSGITCLDVINDHFVIADIWDNEIFIMDRFTNREVRVLRGHAERVTCLEVSDNVIISGSDDTTICIWNEDGSPQRVLCGHQDGVRCLQVIDKTIISGACDGTICVWDPHKSSPQHILRGHEGYVTCLRATNTTIVSVSYNGYDSTICVWDRSTYTLQRTFRNHRREIVCLEIVDDIIILAEDGSGIMEIRDLFTGRLLRTINLEAPIYCMKFINNTLITGSKDGGIRIWGV